MQKRVTYLVLFNKNEHEPMLLSVGVREELPVTCIISHVGGLDRGWRADM
jgi:hypothetical protein